jgi:hypothetical protein
MGDIIQNLNYRTSEVARYWSDQACPEPKYDYTGASPFISYLMSNLARNTSISDLGLETKNAWENPLGVSIAYGTNTRRSRMGQDFNLAFNDTKDLLLLNTIHTWVKYIELMQFGMGNNPRKESNLARMDYMGALYWFVTEPDGTTIVTWGRKTGVFPTSVPWSAIQLNQHGGSQDIPEFSVPFKCQFDEINDISLLNDFNFVMRDGPFYIDTGSTNDTSMEAAMYSYAYAGSIEPIEFSGIAGIADANLLAGPTLSENRCFVCTKHDRGRENQNKSSGYRFVLDFNSYQDSTMGQIENTQVGKQRTDGSTYITTGSATSADQAKLTATIKEIQTIESQDVSAVSGSAAQKARDAKLNAAYAKLNDIVKDSNKSTDQ